MAKKKLSPTPMSPPVGKGQMTSTLSPIISNNDEDDPSTWSKSKKKRMRKKRKREEAAEKLAMDEEGATKLYVSISKKQRASEDDDDSNDGNKTQKLKRSKQSSPEEEATNTVGKPGSTKQPPSDPNNGQDGSSPSKKKKKKNKKKKNKGSAADDTPSSSKTSNESSMTTEDASIENSNSRKKPQMKISIPKPSMMSTLQKAFLERLTSSRFRELNEELYTKPSQDSFKQFTDNPELFDQYHVGFRKQVKEWPVNPVDVICKKVVNAWKKEMHQGAQIDSNTNNKKKLRENKEKVMVADFGCGDAKLAERLLSLKVGKDGQLTNQPSPKGNKGKQLDDCPFDVRSFDLVSGGNPLVTPADMSNVPLPDESVDVGVYCLALMGTNVADFVRESWRVLKFNGVLRVAEVRSRFETSSAEPERSSDKHKGKFGNHKKLKSRNNMHHNNNKRSKTNGNTDEDDTPKPLMLLDEFMALMQRCGFQCTNLDRSNKMFLFMDFIKVDGGSGLSEHEHFSAKPCIYKRR